ncbi:hypothetical protein VTK26DRAFT_8100 [Humicola hyalothermophila]
MDPPPPPSSRDEFGIAIVCALPLEYNAVVPLLDEVWDESEVHLGKADGDLNNTYLNGRIGQHNVVLVCLPERMGKASAAIVATDLRHSYRNLSLVLLVGICGGVPNPGNMEILLGDVIISSSVVQYDFGRQYPDGFRRKNGAKDNLNGPCKEIASTLVNLRLDHVREWLSEKTASFLRGLIQQKPKYAYPGAENDRVFQPDYRHKHQNSPTCECQFHVKESDPVCDAAIESSCEELGCDEAYLVQRKRIADRLAAGPEAGDNPPEPAIYIGSVATGDSVMKSGVTRDKIAARENIIAFEMEAAGMWEHLPSLVVKGVCDYSDSHKSKKWQDYAAAAAASTAKAIILRHIPTERPTPAPSEARSAVIPRPVKPQWVVPFAPDPEFVERPDVMGWLDNKFALHGARVALVGLGGMGKSQLAIQFADKVRDKSHVFWLNATSRRSLEQSYRDIAESLGLESPGDNTPLEVILKRVAGWLRREENGLWTVVVDNLDDGSIFDADDPYLARLLPQSRNGFTLITSRTFNMAQQLTGSARNIWSLPPLSEDCALELFRAKLVDECDEEEGRELVRLMDYMPLAISQAAAYINHRASRVSVAEYMEMFKSSEGREKLLSWDDYADLQRYQDASNSILQTWMLTFQQVQEERPSAIDLLSFMSLFSPQEIPEDVTKGYRGERAFPPPTVKEIMDWPNSSLQSLIPSKVRRRGGSVDYGLSCQIWHHYEHHGNASSGDDGVEGSENSEKPEKSRRHRFSSMAKRLFGGSKEETFEFDEWNDDEFSADLDILLGYSLVATTEKKGVLKMHQLVRTCTQDWLAKTGRLDRWRRRFLMIMAISYQPHYAERDLGVHLDDWLVDMDPQDPLTARLWAWLFVRVATRWMSHGQIAASTALFRRILSTADRFLGPEDELALFALDSIARRTVDGGPDYADEAERLARVLAERAAKLPESVAALRYQRCSAEILSRLGKHDEAERVIRAVVDRSLELFEPNSRRILDHRAAHSLVLAEMGRFEEATEIVVQCLEADWEDLPGWAVYLEPPCPSILAGGHRFRCLERVEPLLREIVETAERVMHRYPVFQEGLYATFHESLAGALAGQGKFEEAKEVLRRGMELRAQVFPDSAIPLPPMYASILERQGFYDEAVERQRQTLAFLESKEGRALFPEQERRYQAMMELGALLYVRGEVDEGSDLLWKAYQGRAKDLGETHHEVIKAKSVYENRDVLPRVYQDRLGKPLDDEAARNEKPAKSKVEVTLEVKEVTEVDLDGVE